MVTLSRGGKAWVREELLYTDDLRRSFAITSSIPENAVAKIRELAQRKRDEQGIAPGADAPIELSDMDREDVIAIAANAKFDTLRISVHHWEGVLDPEDDHPLEFPDELRRLSTRDTNTLFQAAETALREGAPDPNAGGGRSPSDSPITPNRAVRRSTPNGRSRSRRPG